MSDKQEKDMKEWLDKNQGFLSSYLEDLPENSLHEFGLEKKQKILVPVQNESNITNYESTKFLELVKDIADELRVDELCFKILHNVGILTECDRSSLFLVRGKGDQKFLVSKLFDVTRTSTFEESLASDETEIIVPIDKGIAGHVATTKQTINISEAYDDPRFNKEVDKKTGYRTHSILCRPILSSDGECIGVSQIINKMNGRSHAFNQNDIDAFGRFLIFCGIGLKNAQLFEMSVEEYQKNKILLNMTGHIFAEQSSLINLIRNIMGDVKQITNCERCSVYLLEDFSQASDKNINDADEGVKQQQKGTTDEENIFSAVYDMYSKHNDELHIRCPSEISQCKTSQVAKDVVILQKPINIANLELNIKYGGAYFRDDTTGFRTKSVLSVPIFDRNGKIMGVIQQVNKIKKIAFDVKDEGLTETFSIFIGLGIQNCTTYENVCKLMAKHKVAFETLSYHATAQPDETNRLINMVIPKASRLGIYSYEMDDIQMDDFELVKAVIRMFLETEFVNKFRVPYDVLCRWTLSVKKNYRPVIYHNWRHAFNVAQTFFAIVYTGGLEYMFDDLEMFALLVACLCHDLDHRGFNNAFQIKTESPLATLYSTSVMEHHHFDQCIMILNSEGNNIFGSLSSDKYRIVLRFVEHAILSTDLAAYFKLRVEFKDLVESGCKDLVNISNKDLIRAMLMTACDLSATCKPWKIQFRTAKMVASEFFEQGDIEFQKLGEPSMDLMDRSKREDLPKMQCGFYDAIILPLYGLWSRLDNGLTPLYEHCKINRQEWQKLADHNATVFGLDHRRKKKEKSIFSMSMQKRSEIDLPYSDDVNSNVCAIL